MRKVYKKSHRSASLVRRQSMREVKQSFLIVCEGVRTEPDYFRAFRMTAATVKAVGQAMNTASLVSKAISIRDSEQKKKRTYDQCWVVFDKDDFPAKDFNDAIALAERNGFRVAYSNQAFEYWFLLHFNLYKGILHRNSYPDMLSRLMGIHIPRLRGLELSCTTACFITAGHQKCFCRPCRNVAWQSCPGRVLYHRAPAGGRIEQISLKGSGYILFCES